LPCCRAATVSGLATTHIVCSASSLCDPADSISSLVVLPP
jgi:hypothetical protein